MLEEVFAFGDGARLVDLGPADDPLGIDEERRTLVQPAFFVEHAVGLPDITMGPIVGQQGEGYAAELLSPGFEAGDRIGAELQNFDVQLLEFFVVRTEPADLILSPTGESHRQEAHDRRSSTESRERDLLVGVVGGETEVGRRTACLQCHFDFSFFWDAARPPAENTRRYRPAQPNMVRGATPDDHDGDSTTPDLRV